MAFQALNAQAAPPQTSVPAQQQTMLVNRTFVQLSKTAFASRPDLASGILETAQSNQYGLFEDISKYILALQDQLQKAHNAIQEAAATATVITSNSQKENKKRKLDTIEDEEAAANPAAKLKPNEQATSIQNSRVTLDCKDVSFAVPVRKKLRLQLLEDSSDKSIRELRVLNQQSGSVEYVLPASGIECAFSLPVPEKTARQRNFILLPREGSNDASGQPLEQFVFTQNETAIKDQTVETAADVTTLSSDDNYCSITERCLREMLSAVGKSLVLPSDAEFASSIPQSHRKGEKAYHVKAHKGSKEGYLFLLGNGILFGFKKPLVFFPFSNIESISYTSVLQRTFNLVITAMPEGAEGEGVENEFSMLDQADFAGIDAYVKSHGLNDASMAAERRAKAYNVNKDKKEKTSGENAAGDGAAPSYHEDEQSELQKAEQELQDAEDEEEEDYDPSGGESEGEGEDSEEGEDDAEGEYAEEYDEEDGEEVEHEEDVHNE